MRKLVITNRLTNRESKSFKQYLKDIAEIELFKNSEEEFNCAQKASNGDKAAFEELIKRNLRFVVSVAKQYTNSVEVLEDLINEGNIGLIMAAEKYETNMGFKFISFAVWWIRKCITEYLDKNAKLVRLPANKIYAVSKLTKRIDKIEQKLGRSADISEIVESFSTEIVDEDELKILEAQIRSLERLNNTQFDSLDREIDGKSEGCSTLGDMIADDSCNKTDHIIIDQDVKDEIYRHLGHLKPKHRRVLIANFGLDGTNPMTLKEIANELDITREMVRQIRAKSLLQLRELMTESTTLRF